jgi:hypothetical protein
MYPSFFYERLVTTIYMKNVKSKPVDTTIFGKPLDFVMAAQKATKPNLKIPEFLQDAFAYIIFKGNLDEEIFNNCRDGT